MKLETKRDRIRENIVFTVLNRSYKENFERFSEDDYTPIDGYVAKTDNIVGVIEIKCRDTLSTSFPTVFLSVRKKLALEEAYAECGIPSVFVASFADGKVMGIHVKNVIGDPVRIERKKQRASGLVGANDSEDSYLVKISDMYLMGQMTKSELQTYISAK